MPEAPPPQPSLLPQPSQPSQPLLPGIAATRVRTARLTQQVLHPDTVDPRAGGEAVLFVHDDRSSAVVWQQPLLALAADRAPLAVDLRGCGGTEPAPVDTTRGVRDLSDDLAELVTELGPTRVHLVGWGLGGVVVAQLLVDHPELAAPVGSVTLVAPESPHGWGGTGGPDLSELAVRPPVLWVHGDADQATSDTPVPDPAEPPAVGQTRAVLDRYAASGGSYREVVLPGAGHAPPAERPAEFVQALREHLDTPPARPAGLN